MGVTLVAPRGRSRSRELRWATSGLRVLASTAAELPRAHRRDHPRESVRTPTGPALLICSAGPVRVSDHTGAAWSSHGDHQERSAHFTLVPAEPRFSQASTTRAAMPASAALP
ncbi:Uncharacterised protein [Mycobacteroides abscessus subsp. abscessus]|nr:Uncharacterised protein [Mycobacteroides abscessus subsp. abscessus]